MDSPHPPTPNNPRSSKRCSSRAYSVWAARFLCRLDENKRKIQIPTDINRKIPSAALLTERVKSNILAWVSCASRERFPQWTCLASASLLQASRRRTSA
jgi:hypothetical protein